MDKAERLLQRQLSDQSPARPTHDILHHANVPHRFIRTCCPVCRRRICWQRLLRLILGFCLGARHAHLTVCHKTLMCRTAFCCPAATYMQQATMLAATTHHLPLPRSQARPPQQYVIMCSMLPCCTVCRRRLQRLLCLIICLCLQARHAPLPLIKQRVAGAPA